MPNRNRIVTFVLALAILTLPITLAACSKSSPGEDSGASGSSASQGSASQDMNTSDGSAGNSSDKSYSISTSEITESYMGAAENGETVYYVGNGDGSKTGIFFLNSEKGAHVSFMGTASETEKDGERLITITDEISGNTITFGVAVNDDSSITIDMGSELGKAVLAKCEVSEAVDAIKTIQGNTTQVG